MLQKRMETGGWRKWGILLTPELEKNELDGSLEPSKRSSVSSYRQIYPGIGQAEITTAHRQACESDREQMHKGQIGRQRGKGKGKSKVRTVHQSTRTKCRHNQVKRPSKQERKQESKERKIRLVYHIRELTKEGKKSGLKLKKRSISWTTGLGAEM